MSCWAIIAAAGSGSRMGGGRVKTLQLLGGLQCGKAGQPVRWGHIGGPG